MGPRDGGLTPGWGSFGSNQVLVFFLDLIPWPESTGTCAMNCVLAQVQVDPTMLQSLTSGKGMFSYPETSVTPSYP